MVGSDIYVVAATKVHMKFPDLCRFLPQWVRSHGYSRQSTLRIEPKANGLSVIDQLRETTDLNVTKTPTPHDSKETRLNAVSPYIESGRVWLVEDAWNEEFITEVCGFPAQPHDEYVDVLGYAINFHREQDSDVDDEELLRDFL
jgi:predicted phage terminase large subunit-like protein